LIDEAVVIAGGLGTRICSVMGCVCKQIIRIHGIELFMYPIISLYRAGVTRFYIVGNPVNYHLLDNVLNKYSRLLGFEYFLDINPYVETYNGNTALIGLKNVKNPVFLSVSDHIYPPKLPYLMASENTDADVVIAGDEKPVLVDVGEATKIAVNKYSRVKRISKNLDNYDYIDAGLFIVNNPGKITRLFNIEKPVKLTEIFSHSELDVRVHGFKGIIWKDIDFFEDLEYVYDSQLGEIVRDTVNYVSKFVK